jgi:hypothetical protein
MRSGNRFVLAAVALAACGGGGGSAEFPGRGSQVHAVLSSIEGGDVNLARLRGQVVVLHFFTTWSLAAQVDVGELRRAADGMPPGAMTIVGVGMDPDGPKLLRPWKKAVGAAWEITVPSDELAAGQSGLGRIQVVPTTVVLDGGGRIAWRHEGGLPPGELPRVVKNVERRGAPH